MRVCSSFSFFCRTSKANKKGYAPIELCISINGTRKFINLPRKERPEDFSKKRKSKDLQDYLNLMYSKVNEITTDMLRNEEPLTAEKLRDYLRTGGYKQYTVEQLFNDFLNIQRKRIDLTQGAYRKYELLKELFLRHISPDAEIKEITNSIVQEFYIILQNRYSTATSASYIAKLKTIIQYGIDNDKIKVNPFQTIKVKRERKKIEYLTNDELKILESAHLDNESLQRVLDCFLFQCYSGLAYIDAEHLTPEDVKENNGTYYIIKERVKTKVQYTSVLLPKAVDILKKYDYRLPVISNQKTNVYLHQIERLLNIGRKLYSHLGRKTYGHILLNSNVRMETVAKALGHSNSKTTARYYAELENDTIIEEIAQAI